MPEARPPPPTGHDDRREVGDVLEQLEPERALAGDHDGVVEGVDEGHPGLGGALARGGDGAPRPRSRVPHRRAEGRAAVDLRDRRAVGHEDLARHAAHARGLRERPRVVAGAPGRDAAGAAVAEGGELVQRAADLERPRALEVLGLQRHRGAACARSASATAAPACAARRRRSRRERARPPRRSRSAGARRWPWRQSGSATMASISTCAPSGSAATPIVVRAGGSSPKNAP